MLWDSTEPSAAAFLDDSYVLTTRDRAHAARDTVVEIVQGNAASLLRCSFAWAATPRRRSRHEKLGNPSGNLGSPGPPGLTLCPCSRMLQACIPAFADTCALPCPTSASSMPPTAHTSGRMPGQLPRGSAVRGRRASGPAYARPFYAMAQHPALVAVNTQLRER